ncbi:MAG: UDP-N-acetylglucosamine--LPS N-acetylglucosamine transferase [Acidimicrobiia bacterium]|nr:UDP-N-acetylglucosamine--LPS N-acetylglucosamine transferase [Acidimicrobiia bacterium]
MPESLRHSIILATSNGTGMGHLARQTSIALALGDRADPILFSMSRAVPLVFELGIRGEYVPSSDRVTLEASVWQHYLADRISALLEETGARVFAFDGVWPYYGIIRARLRHPRVAFVWMRRPLWRPGSNERALDARHRFDLVLEPGDLAATADSGITADLEDVERLPPVTLLSQVDRLPRAEAAEQLGLDPGRPAALVTLRGDEPDGGATRAVQTVLGQADWQVAVTRKLPDIDDDRVVRLHYVFPLARYLEAFDIGVVEAGYNSFHEMLHAGIPTVTVATAAAITDDQVARSHWAAEQGFALSAEEGDPSGISEAVGRLLDPVARDAIRERCAALAPPEGARVAADRLVQLSGNFTRHRIPKEERTEMRRRDWRNVRQRARRLAGRVRHSQSGPSTDAGDEPELVSPVPLVETVTMDELGATPPPEHVLSGTSDNYRRARTRIVTNYLG